MMERLAQVLEAIDGLCAFEFQHMAHQFVGKSNGPVFHVRKLFAVLVFTEWDVSAGEYIQGITIHDHVFHLDAVTLPKFIICHKKQSLLDPSTTRLRLSSTKRITQL